MDTLLGYIREPRMQAANVSMFPWLLWFIWKARNDMCFTAKNVSPLDTVQHARQETEEWRVAQIVEEVIEEEQVERELEQPVVQPARCRWKCQVDASWKSTTKGVGVGFVLLDDDRVIMVGLRNYTRAASPLQAEAEGLSWAMKELLHRDFKDVRFESDCQQLV